MKGSSTIEKVGLIAGISGRELTRELKKIGKIVYLIGGRPDEAGFDEADHFFCIDLRNREQIAKHLKDNGIEHVILGTGHELAFALAAYLEEKGVHTSVDVEASRAAKNKAEFKKLLEEKGYLTPRYMCLKDKEYALDSIINYVGIPCVVKSPTDKQLPQKVNTKSELETLLSQNLKSGNEVLLEEFIDGIDCTIPVVANYLETKALLFSYYSKAESCHLNGFQKNVCKKRLNPEKEQEILKLSEEIIRETGIIGLCRLDLIINEEKYYILECNSVIVTGVHPNQIEYGRNFIEREKINFAQILVENAFQIFQQKTSGNMVKSR
jgi:carbamoylphosphate synthase large subunit